ncbi:MAG: ROK family protein [Nocardia sp.]|nr:ROK family protein [Nocardia sp.]
MRLLALKIGSANFTAGHLIAGPGVAGIRRIPIPLNAAWETCRDLLINIADDDEVAAVGIACSGPIRTPDGAIAPPGISQWRSGFAIADAVRRTFPAATVEIASDRRCLRLAEQNITPVAGADMVLVGAGILALVTTSRLCHSLPALPMPNSAGMVRRPTWPITCHHTGPV